VTLKNFFLSLQEHLDRGIFKIKSLLPIYGSRGTFNKIIKNIFWLERMYRLEKKIDGKLIEIELRMPLICKVISIENDIMSWNGRSDILSIRGEYGWVQFIERIRRGDLLFTSYYGKIFVGFVWVQLTPAKGGGFQYSVLLHDVYAYDAWTFTAYRGNRVLPFLLQHVDSYLHEYCPEKNTVIAHITECNKPSISAFTHAGYKITAKKLSFVFIGFNRKFLYKHY
jgi:hypothetical protein